MSKHHKIPTSIEKRVKTALSYYPQLDNINIEFKLKKNIRSQQCKLDLHLIVFLNLKKRGSF